MKLSDRLTSLRKERRITLIEASRRCGCSYQHLQKLEKDKAFRPKLDLLYKLAAYYQFPSDTLIIEAGKIPQDVYFKIVRCPSLLKIIREYQE